MESPADVSHERYVVGVRQQADEQKVSIVRLAEIPLEQDGKVIILAESSDFGGAHDFHKVAANSVVDSWVRRKQLLKHAIGVQPTMPRVFVETGCNLHQRDLQVLVQQLGFERRIGRPAVGEPPQIGVQDMV